MSWKLTKKLKETHLAPLANTFSRSSSQSTITTDAPAKSPSGSTTPSIPAPTSNLQHSTSSNGNDTQNIAASEALISPPAPEVRPGILILTLHEGQGFSLPPGAEQSFQRPGHGSSMSTGSFATGSYMGNSARPGSSQMQQSYRPASSAGGINAVPSTHGRYHSKYLPYALLDFDKQQVFVNAVSGTPENPLWPGESTQYKFDVSRTTEVSLSLYMRNPSAPPNAGRQQDIFIGTCRITPRFSEDTESGAPQQAAADKSKKDKNGSMPPPPIDGKASGVQWHNIQYGTGALRIGVKYVENKQRSLKIEDFELLKVVGKGSFGKVMQVMKKDTQRIYALKTIRKQHIISRSEVTHTLAERSVLAQINNPFIVPLKFSFQSPEKLYLVLAFVNGGELFHHLQKEQRFDINRSRFYAAELLCALECLHGFGVIYRDLKPENILVDYVGHIALCDFGLCKLDMKDEDKTNTFCGTPEYLAPELLHGQGYTKAVDWWTLGVLLYEMLTGLPPFYDENTNEMYRKILAEPLHFPGPDVFPPAARGPSPLIEEPKRPAKEPKRLVQDPEVPSPAAVSDVPGFESSRYAPAVSWAPQVSYAPEVSYAPAVSYAPEVSYIPGTEWAPNVEWAPDVEWTTDSSWAPDVSSAPAVEPSPNVEPAPEIAPTPEVNPAPMITAPPSVAPAPRTLPPPRRAFIPTVTMVWASA